MIKARLRLRKKRGKQFTNIRRDKQTIRRIKQQKKRHKSGDTKKLIYEDDIRSKTGLVKSKKNIYIFMYLQAEIKKNVIPLKE